MNDLTLESLFELEFLPFAELSLKTTTSSSNSLVISKTNQSFADLFNLTIPEVLNLSFEELFKWVSWQDQPYNQWYSNVIDQISGNRESKKPPTIAIEQDQRTFQLVAMAKSSGTSSLHLVIKVNQNQLEQDNAELKQILNQNQQLLESVLNTQKEMICRFTPDTVLTYTNKAYAHNFNQSSDQLIGTSFLKFVPTKDHEFIRDHLKTIARTKEQVTYIHQVTHKDGKVGWQEWTDFPILDEQGNLIEFQSVGIDITEQKQAENETKRLSDLLTDAQKIAHLGAWAMDVESFRTVWTDEIYQIYEVDKTFDHNKANGLAFYHPEDQPLLLEALNNVVANAEPFDLTLRFITAKQNNRWMRVSGRLAESWDGKPTVIGIIQDITKQKRIEEELTFAQQRIESIFTEMSDVVWSVSFPDFTMEFITPSAYELYGYDLSSWYEDSRLWEHIIHPEDQWVINTIYADLEHQGWFEYTYRIVTQQGKQKWIRNRSKIILGHDNKALRLDGYTIDVTKEMEIQVELERAKAEALEASKAKSLFLANMSHEIRTPLNAVIGYSDLIHQTQLDQVQGEYLSHVLTAAKSLLDIINDILDLSKIEAGKLELEKVPTSLLEILENTAYILSYQVENKHLDFRLFIDPSIPSLVMADPVRLKQILVNLLSNAVKFTQQGSIEIGIKLTNSDSKMVSVLFLVSDTGIGMTDEQRLQLFKSFSQGDSSTTRKFGGTGLGLVISNLLASKMGSQIDVYSKMDEGSTFSFTISFERLDSDCQGCFDFLPTFDHISKLILVGVSEKKFKMMSGYSSLCDLQVYNQSTPYFVDQLLTNTDDRAVIYLQDWEQLDQVIQKIEPSYPFFFVVESKEPKPKEYADLKIFQLKPPFKPSTFFNLLVTLEEYGSVKTTDWKKEQELTISSQAVTDEERVFSGGIDETVLIAEDISMNMLLIKTLVRKKFPRVEIIEASNGKMALDLAKHHKPDLILMDVQMPEMDGIEATKAIRSWEKQQTQQAQQNQYVPIPIFALSAGVLTEEQDKCLAAGMNGFLTKPINPENLYEKLSQYLGN